MLNRIENLRKLYGPISERSSNKVKNILSDEIIQFISKSPFAVLSSADSDGNCDASPRGGLPGFVKIIDEKTLFVPDIKGNKLFQSFENFTSNPKAGLVFFIPGNNNTVRVNGRVSIVEKGEVLATINQIEVAWKDDNSELIQGFILKVDEAYTHCPRALNFSDLWNIETVESNGK